MTRCRIGLIALGLVGALLVARASDAPRVAVMDFVLATSPGTLEPTVADLSRAMQAKLLATADYAWVERQEMDRITDETDLGGMSRVDPLSAVRLGHLLRADLLLRGEVAPRGPGEGELVMEVVDLKRAELLATRRVTLAMTRRERLRPTAAEVEAVTATAQAALAEARRTLEQAGKLRVIAPLYFKNTSATDRLGYLEDRLKKALASAAGPASGCRTLQFPRVGEAAEEASLVLSGLTDTDPDAWQHVADAYVWGTFTEQEASGVAFEDVPVTISVQVWSGSGEPRDVSWHGLAKEADAGVGTVVAGVLEAVRAAPRDAPRTAAERQRIAQSLRARADQLWQPVLRAQRDWQEIAAFVKTAYGRQLHAYRRRMLETAAFFDPLNGRLQKERLEATWSFIYPFNALDTIRGQWLRLADYQAQARRFRLTPDGMPDPFWPERLTDAMGAFSRMLKSADWQPEKLQSSFEDIHRNILALHRLLSKLIVETNQGTVPPARPPGWLAEQNRQWLSRLLDYSEGFKMPDPLISREEIEKTWPVLQETAGIFLKTEANVEKKDNLVANLTTVYDNFGEVDRALAMLDSAWRLARNEGQSSPADAERPAPARPPRIDQPWGLKAGPSGIVAVAQDITLPQLSAVVREIEPWTEVYSKVIESDGIKRFSKAPGRTIDAMAWDGSQLWFEETNQPLPPSIGPANPEGGYYLWSFDPVLNSAKLVTAKLGGHSAIPTLLSSDPKLWLGLDSGGVWALDRQDLSVRRYRGEDGLMTSHLLASQAGAQALFFLGRGEEAFFVNQFTLADGKWTGFQVPGVRDPSEIAGPAPASIAVSGDWLCVVKRFAWFYNLKTGQWVDLWKLAADPAVGAGPRIQRWGFSFVSADETGFWFGVPGGIQFLNPNAPTEIRRISVPGLPVVAAHRGPWLWLGLGAGKDSSRVVLLDKRSGTSTGALTVPMAPIRNIVATDQGAWVGGAKLLEIRLLEPKPGVPIVPEAKVDSHALFRAAYNGDLDGLERVLAAKPDVNQATDRGWTALMTAAAAGQATIARRLLAAGANPNQLSADGAFPLQIAIEAGADQVAEALLAGGADPNLASATIIRREFHFSRLVEPVTPDPAAPGAPPPITGLTATVTDIGDVVLHWSENPNHLGRYKVARAIRGQGASWNIRASLPARTSLWVDRDLGAANGEVSYTVIPEGRNGSGESDSLAQATSATVTRTPPPFARVVRYQYFDQYWKMPMPPVVHSRPALSVAAIRGNTALVRQLLERKADPNRRDAVGATPLMLALQYGNHEVARLLLAQGARVELEDEDDQTAAYLVYQRHEDEALLDEILAKMTPERRWIEASSLITTAARRGQIRDMEKLVARGGEISANTLLLENALTAAISGNQVETVDWLLTKGFPLKAKDLPAWMGGTQENVIAATACRCQNSQILTRLIEAGLDVNADIEGKPFIAAAAVMNNLELVRLLKSHGADTQRKSAKGKLPAEYATGAVQALLKENGSLPSWRLSGGFQATEAGVLAPQGRVGFKDHEAANNALLAACTKGDQAAAASALAAGADINTIVPTGDLPILQCALNSGNADLVRWLLEEGAWVNAINWRGESAVTAAVRLQRPDLVELLLAAGADVNSREPARTGAWSESAGNPALIYAILKDDLKLTERLLDAGADPNIVCRRKGYSISPIAAALAHGKTDLVDLLLSRGANPRAQLYSFVTQPDGTITKQPLVSLLMRAASSGKVPLIRRMIALGQDPHLKTKEGYDALAWAAGAGAREAVEFLLPLSAHRGLALEWAESEGHAEVAGVLRQAGYNE